MRAKRYMLDLYGVVVDDEYVHILMEMAKGMYWKYKNTLKLTTQKILKYNVSVGTVKFLLSRISILKSNILVLIQLNN